ncbi:MAG: DUF6395 domain-containing protein, partial [Candidatus Paceibacterota bacterium]
RHKQQLIALDHIHNNYDCISFIMESDIEMISLKSVGRVGFPSEYACCLPCVILADHIGITAIATGTIGLFIKGTKFHQFNKTPYYKTYKSLFAKAGIDLFWPVGGVVDRGTAIICQKTKIPGQSCVRNDNGFCNNCFKCFRKNTLLLGKSYISDPTKNDQRASQMGNLSRYEKNPSNLSRYEKNPSNLSRYEKNPSQMGNRIPTANRFLSENRTRNRNRNDTSNFLSASDPRKNSSIGNSSSISISSSSSRSTGSGSGSGSGISSFRKIRIPIDARLKLSHKPITLIELYQMGILKDRNLEPFKNLDLSYQSHYMKECYDYMVPERMKKQICHRLDSLLGPMNQKQVNVVKTLNVSALNNVKINLDGAY